MNPTNRWSPYTVARDQGYLDREFVDTVDKLAELPIMGVRTMVMYNADVVNIRGVGPKKAEALRAQGILTIGDFVLAHGPMALPPPK
jgi:hypothetical protein